MLDPAKMQKLTQLVQSSSILNAQEKAEWLSLIGLMNDKQLAELEEILQSSAMPISTPATRQSPVMEAPTPSLSHISNLPSQMVDPRLKAQSTHRPLAPGPDKDFAESSRLTPMSAKRPEPGATKPTPAPAPRPVAPPAPKLEPDLSRPTISSPILSAEAAAKGLKLMAMSDVSKLTAEALHRQNRANFFAAISALAEKEGYFQVLAHVEESPLYQDYLNYGKLILSGVSGDNLPLSQEEFEFVADLLQALKINRV